ncbi:MAG: hypothetical protein IKN04_05115 [Clostridia bacterium]|nr:hypothetical protein [Clostridia bacterium]
MSEENPKVKLFREKSLEAVESPESLNDYLRVTSPGIWLVMATVVILLIGGILWGIFGHIRTTAEFAVSVGPEKSICYVNYNVIDKVLARGVIHVEGADYPLKTNEELNVTIVSEETPPRVLLSGNLSMGDPVVEVPVIIDLPEGYYIGEVVTEDLKPISLLMQ